MQKIWNVGLLLLGIGAIVISIVKNTPNNEIKIAYIDTDKVISEYIGMKEARKIFEKEASELDANLDSLKMDYNRAVNHLNAELSQMTEETKAEKSKVLQVQYQNYQEYAKVVETKKREKDQTLMTGMLSQIDNYIQEYGEKHGYTVILGKVNGNVLYGNSPLDLTNEILQALNKRFKGK